MPKANGRGDPFAGKIFQELKGAVDQLVSLVSSLESQLKSLWMIDSCFDSINLNSLIVEVIQSDAARFAASGIRVDTDIAAALPALQADANCLHRCSSIFSAMLRMPCRRGSLECQCGCARGLGVARNRRHRRRHCAGLGHFSTVYHIEATRHGPRVSDHPAYCRNPWRTITYRSEPGKGTTFCLKFPSSFGTRKISVRRAAVADDSSERFFGCLCHAPEK